MNSEKEKIDELRQIIYLRENSASYKITFPLRAIHNYFIKRFNFFHFRYENYKNELRHGENTEYHSLCYNLWLIENSYSYKITYILRLLYNLYTGNRASDKKYDEFINFSFSNNTDLKSDNIDIGSFECSLKKFDINKENLLIVTHESSRTGAPVVALGLVNELSKKYNIITLSILGGELLDCFSLNSSVVIGTFEGYSWYTKSFMGNIINKIHEKYPLKKAIVNCCVSWVCLESLNYNNINTTYLVHDFATYFQHGEALMDSITYPNKIVFSTDITKKDWEKYIDLSLNNNIYIIPQGRVNPESFQNEIDAISNKNKTDDFLLYLNKNKKIILGCGSVILRKGIDHFISVAYHLKKVRSLDDFVFIWIGAGYDPDRDLQYSAYLMDQMQRLQVADSVVFMEPIPNLDLIYRNSYIFLMTPRLDPLPNVALDAIHHNVPIVCYSDGTGISSLLKSNELLSTCLGEYLDPQDAARIINKVMDNDDLYFKIKEQLKNLSNDISFEKYSNKIDALF